MSGIVVGEGSMVPNQEVYAEWNTVKAQRSKSFARQWWERRLRLGVLAMGCVQTYIPSWQSELAKESERRRYGIFVGFVFVAQEAVFFVISTGSILVPVF